MKEGLKGQTLFEVQRMVDEQKLDELATALDSTTASETARLVPFFGPSITGEQVIVDKLGVDMSRALLGSLTYRWARPFRSGERVNVKVSVEDFYEKAGMQFVVVLSEFTDEVGSMIQTHRAVFIERGAA